MFSLYKNDGEILYGIKEYIIDSLEDIKDLPKNLRPGSTAIVISTGQTYMFSPQQKWVLFGRPSSGSSTDSSVEDLLNYLDQNQDGIVDKAESSTSIELLDF